MPILDAIAVSATDMVRSVGFYAALGFDFSNCDLEADHVEPAQRKGEPRLMIDSAALMERLTGAAPVPANHSIFAMLCENVAEVDQLADALVQAGGTIVTAPWDAFWGQRYATIADPDGTRIDLFAPLD